MRCIMEKTEDGTDKKISVDYLRMKETDGGRNMHAYQNRPETDRPEQTPFFPLFVDLWKKKIVIVGGGTIALRRMRCLLPFEPELWIVAPEIKAGQQSVPQSVHLLKQTYEPSVCQGAFLVLAATDDTDLNARICRDGKACGAYVNNASDREQCDFYFPGIIRKENCVIGISSSGTDHAGTKNLRKKVEQVLEIEDGMSFYPKT